MGKVIGFSHVAVKSDRFEEAFRFYTEGLGLRCAVKGDQSAVLVIPDGTVIEVFGGGETVRNTAGCTHFCLNAYNVHAAMARAVEYGASVKKEVYPLGGLRIGFVVAPTGEEVEFWDIDAKGDELACDENGCYIKTFVHPAFTVADMEASVKFYEALGMRRKVDWDGGCSMVMDDNREIEIFAGGHICDNTSGISHVCFLVDDMEAALEAAVAAGGVITDMPNWSENFRFAFFRGISGEIVEFFRMYPEKEGTMFRIPDTAPAIK